MIDLDKTVREFENHTPTKVKATGRDLAERFRVKPLHIQHARLVAEIDDAGRIFNVEINRTEYAQSWYCSCGRSGYDSSNRACPHLWALLVTADSQGWFGNEDAVAVHERLGHVQRSTQSVNIALDAWKLRLNAIALLTDKLETSATNSSRDLWPANRQVLYVIDAEATLRGEGLAIQTMTQESKRDGAPGRPKPLRLRYRNDPALPESIDRLILATLLGGDEEGSYRYGFSSADSESTFTLDDALATALLPMIVKTGRCFLRPITVSGQEPMLLPLQWGSDQPWRITLAVRREGPHYLLQSQLVRDGETRPINALQLGTRRIIIHDNTVEPVDAGDAMPWAVGLKNGALHVPAAAGEELVERLYALPRPSRLELPPELALEEITPTPTIALKISPPSRDDYQSRLRADLSFDYHGRKARDHDPFTPLIDRKNRRVILRNAQVEREAQQRLLQLGFRQSNDYYDQAPVWRLTPSKLAKTVVTLVKEGWQVHAEGKLYRQPGQFNLNVTSGIDWFELHGQVQFGNQVATLPQLLAALRKGENLVQLGDGTVGMLPEEWLKKYGALAAMGREQADHLRFTRAQAGLLDALLAAQPQATCDHVFENTRRMLHTFEGIQPLDPLPAFQGQLRPYQKDGMGWLHFLRSFSFGGCLADDMGLGKTVQVLAMLLQRRAHFSEARESHDLSDQHRPSLIVVPRSLVFNWLEESRRFTPDLKFLDHSHSARAKAAEHFADYDVILTTYGTLRRDAAYLKDFEFDYLILDEAQAIKNAASESAKAARLLNGRHRLALSGTPVQNHLGDLWSLFEFLNPGMLGTSSVLSGSAGLTKSADPETRGILARALRPFILRRTKEQVAKDLPEKLEQTIYCELDSKQRDAYNELKEFYRASLLDLVAREGMNKAKIQILEALLRLRQAACHPGLIDKTQTDESSAKLETLLPRLAEIAEEGHKALVFSQFTSFLSIVKKRLDKDKIKYEYLDGKTKDRQARVDRFQSDDKCKLFLISLKAGGLGLNLTAADYVFLLDPWWNPAVEAQAIDRTHRIGQTRQVFACRLIAKDTVEEKVLELQKTKRDLADSIINADNSLISSMGRQELELLLS